MVAVVEVAEECVGVREENVDVEPRAKCEAVTGADRPTPEEDPNDGPEVVAVCGRPAVLSYVCVDDNVRSRTWTGTALVLPTRCSDGGGGPFPSDDICSLFGRVSDPIAVEGRRADC